MIIKYKYGIDFDGIKYGWKDKKLFRMPQMIGKRFMPLKELALVDVGKQKGYYLNLKKKSLPQLEAMTTYINFEYEKVIDNDCPF